MIVFVAYALVMREACALVVKEAYALGEAQLLVVGMYVYYHVQVQVVPAQFYCNAWVVAPAACVQQ